MGHVGTKLADMQLLDGPKCERGMVGNTKRAQRVPLHTMCLYLNGASDKQPQDRLSPRVLRVDRTMPMDIVNRLLAGRDVT